MARINIEEVAKKAGVSRSTVSRVLNHQPKVKEETRQRVQRVMEELHYVPSAAARSLASRSGNVVGMLAYNIVQPFWTEVFGGVEQYISRNTDCGIFLANSKSHLEARDDRDDYKRNLRNLVSRGVDGLIIALAQDLRPDDIVFLESCDIPYVVIQNHLQDPRVTSVNVDNVDGALRATRHLLSMGHRRIVHATGPMDHGSARDRAQGFTQGMREAGLPAGEDGIVACGYLFQDGYRCMGRLLARKKPPTAVLFGNDASAFGGFLAAREAGVSIPGSLSIFGFDHLAKGMDVAGLLPDLATMGQPVTELGAAAAGLLVRKMGGEAQVESIQFRMTLHPGRTAAPITKEAVP